MTIQPSEVEHRLERWVRLRERVRTSLLVFAVVADLAIGGAVLNVTTNTNHTSRTTHHTAVKIDCTLDSFIGTPGHPRLATEGARLAAYFACLKREGQ